MRVLGAVLVLFLVEAASFGLTDHRRAAVRAFERADSLRSLCISADLAHVEAGKNPLVPACDARPVFQAYLLGLRHLLVFLPPETSESCLTLVAELDLELSLLAAAGRVEPYFFWHGPKRHVPLKLGKVLDCRLLDGAGRSVRELLESTEEPEWSLPAASTPAVEFGKLGLAYPLEAVPLSPRFFSAMSLRVATPSADVCSASAKAVLHGVRRLIIAGDDPELQLKSCIDSSLEVVLDLHGCFGELFFEGASRQPLEDAIERALLALERDAVDVLALPAAAWVDKRLNQYVASSIPNLLKGGKVKGVAIAGAVTSKQLDKILNGATPPSLWLAPHDDCGLVAPAQLKTTATHSLPVIAFTSSCGSAILEWVAAHEGLSESGVLVKWAGELGMDVAWDESVTDLASELQTLRSGVPLSADSWALLSSLPFLTLPPALSAQFGVADFFGLRPILSRVAALAERSRQQEHISVVEPTEKTLSADVLKSVVEDKKKFDDNYFFLYKDNLLAPDVYRRVQEEAARLWGSTELEANCNLDGRDRMGGYVIDAATRNHSLYSVFYSSEEFRQWVSAIVGHFMFPSDFPIELREYPAGSRGMVCHRDLLMYRNETLDLEFVFTIDNLGTCVSTNQDRRGKTTETHTKANSLIMLRPNAALHCVKPSQGGHRTILKFIMVGDYRKSSEFGSYKENSCGAENPNAQLLAARRESGEL